MIRETNRQERETRRRISVVSICVWFLLLLMTQSIPSLEGGQTTIKEAKDRNDEGGEGGRESQGFFSISEKCRENLHEN